MDTDIFAQLVMVDLVKSCARLIANLSLVGAAPKGIPNLDDVLISEIANVLNERQVPNRVAADILGVSLSTIHRKRNVEGAVRYPIVAEIIWFLAEGAQSVADLATEFSAYSSLEVNSALRYLHNVGAIEKEDNFIILAKSWVETSQSLGVILATMSKEPTSLDTVASLLDQSTDDARQTVETLEKNGLIAKDKDGQFRSQKLFKLTPSKSDGSEFFTVVELFFSAVTRALVNRIATYEDGEHEAQERELSYFKIPIELESEYFELQKKFSASVKSMLEDSPLISEEFIEAFVGFCRE